jgi:predicted 3-demethylubiquinone-9 3-methyltransferase (glyoxalase superfamily)
MVVNFELNGQFFMGLNGEDNFKFNEAVSYFVPCKDQGEIDHYWNSVIAGGGKEDNCGWCKNKFGMSWQVVPAQLGELMSQPKKRPASGAGIYEKEKVDIDKLQNA